MSVILSSTLLLLCAAFARSNVCYSCSYISLLSSSDSSNCIKPNAQTSTVSCSGGCSSDISSSSVSRGCSSCFLSSTCTSCTGDRCNSQAASFTTCYSCNTVSDNTCTAPVKGVTPTTLCSGQCMKTVSSYSSYEATSRDCSSICVALSGDLFGAKFKTSCCTGDYCNGATGMAMSLAATAAALFVYLLV